MSRWKLSKNQGKLNKRECIPVGCVPPTAMAVSPAMHAPYHARHHPTMHAPLPCMPPAIHAPPCHACPPAMYPSCHTRPPPPEQNHRRLWKHNLVATSSRAVKIRNPDDVQLWRKRLVWTDLNMRGYSLQARTISTQQNKIILHLNFLQDLCIWRIWTTFGWLSKWSRELHNGYRSLCKSPGCVRIVK